MGSSSMIQLRANAWGDPGVSTSAGLETTRKNILIRADRPRSERLHGPSDTGLGVGGGTGDGVGATGDGVGATGAMVGEEVLGASEGLEEGAPEAVTEGATEGAPEGLSIGASEGDSEGVSEAVTVGGAEAVTEGDAEGDSKGLLEGDAVGEAVGVLVGALVGDPVGGTVGITTGGVVVTGVVGAGVSASKLPKFSTNSLKNCLSSSSMIKSFGLFSSCSADRPSFSTSKY